MKGALAGLETAVVPVVPTVLVPDELDGRGGVTSMLFFRPNETPKLLAILAKRVRALRPAPVVVAPAADAEAGSAPTAGSCVPCSAELELVSAWKGKARAVVAGDNVDWRAVWLGW